MSPVLIDNSISSLDYLPLNSLRSRRNLINIYLDEDSKFIDSDDESIFGYRRSELLNQHLSLLFPELQGVQLIIEGKLNKRLTHKCYCGHLFKTQDKRREESYSELRFVELNELKGKRTIKLIVIPV